eukprot:5356447-Heterocapsa_arctica.AAC.1
MVSCQPIPEDSRVHAPLVAALASTVIIWLGLSTQGGERRLRADRVPEPVRAGNRTRDRFLTRR